MRAMLPDDPRHGSEAGFEQHLRDDETPCESCARGDILAGRRRHKRKAMGHVYTLPLGQPNHDKLTTLRRKGASWGQLAEWVGVSDSVIWRLLTDGPEQMVYTRTFVRVRDMKPGRIVTTVGVTRRLRALAWLGYTSPVVAAESGVHEDTVRDARNGVLAFVHETTATALVATYDRLSMTLAEPRDAYEQRGITRSRNHARRARWSPPLAWDDIDDPDAEPYRAPKHYAPGRPNLRDAHIENAEWMAAAGETLTAVCERLNLDPETFYSACRRAGRTDLYARLSSREPTGEMAMTLRKVKRAVA